MQSSLRPSLAREERSSLLGAGSAGSGALFEVKHSAGGLAMATLGPLSIALWRTKPTRLLFEIQRSELARVVDAHPGLAAFVCIVQEGTADPDDDVRKASAAMISGHGKNLAAVACVIEGSGFRAAITRTVLTGIVLLARNPSPTKFFENVQGAGSWLGTLIGKERVAGLNESVARLR